MIDKFSEKLLASPEKIDKPLKVVEAYIRQNRNQPSALLTVTKLGA